VNIGLIDIEPKVVNTALMQISQYHKEKGDTVEWATPLTYHLYDKLYCSSLFDFTDKRQIPKGAVCGGTGFDLTTALPKEIEDCQYDYSIYPQCDYSIVWFSRGCIRKCPFCVVWKKEGKISPVDPKRLNPNGGHIKIQDNNFFANPEWRTATRFLFDSGQKVNFSSGIDVRILTKEQCGVINSLKHEGQIHIAWDNPKDDLFKKLEIMTRHIKPYKIMCYVLIGYWSTPKEDLMRVEILNLLGVDPFVMPYDKKDPYQKRFARWVNRKAIFKSVEWKDYR
jgi:hypothetical protein